MLLERRRKHLWGKVSGCLIGASALLRPCYQVCNKALKKRTKTDKVCNVYLDGVEIASKKAQGEKVEITLPNEDGLISLEYVTA